MSEPFPSASPTLESDAEPTGEADTTAIVSTGDPRVDAALARLDDLERTDLHEHAEVFGDIHARLVAALGDPG